METTDSKSCPYPFSFLVVGIDKICGKVSINSNAKEVVGEDSSGKGIFIRKETSSKEVVPGNQ